MICGSQELAAVLQAQLKKIADGRDAVIPGEAVSHVVFIHMDNLCQQIQGNGLFEMFVNISANCGAGLGGVIGSRKHASRLVIIAHQQNKENIE